MTSLFKNNYKIYLYKYNYSALQNSIADLMNNNSANQFLFESFVTDLYTLGVPSDNIIKALSSKSSDAEKIKSKYDEYVNDYYNKKSNLSTSQTNQSKQIGESQTLEYKPLGKENTDVLLKYNRATISGEDDLVQKALAQNYALQMLQRDYENSMMSVENNEIKINWLNTMEKKEAYDNYIKKALDLSTNLLNKLFDPVIEDIQAIQEGKLERSKYVHVIELTDLSSCGVIDEVITERTKYTNDNFIALNTSRGDFSNDNKENSVDSVGVITTTLEGLSNMTNFNLRQDILLKHNINIEANDIIEIVNLNQNKLISKTISSEQNINNTINRNTQFIGFVTKVSLSQRFGGVSLLNVSCEGISKVLSLNPTISSNAIAPQFNSVIDFIAGTDKQQKTSSAAVTNVFSTFFDGLNAFDLFTKLLSDVLAVSPVEEDKTSYVLRLISDPAKLKKLPYQYAKPLIILYHLAVTTSTIREVGKSTHIVLAKVENNVNQEKLQAYLLMLRSHFDLFWSNMTTPLSILQTLANNTFLEIFEDRNGILILRPPRYNVWINDDVIDENDFIEWTQSIDDSTLKSRSDYQWSIPAIGVQNEFCGGYYQDIPALLKYGFRIDSPKNSPSVQSEIDAAVYSALDVTKSNSNTRTFELTVPLTQDYILGRLYYFPINKSINGNILSTGFVGYLTTISTTISPGNVDIHRLTFKYMRVAELIDNMRGRNNLADIQKSGAYILNFKRLPELSMYQSSITPNMLTEKQQKRIEDKANNLCANNRYYWAAYHDPFKKKFDNWTKSNRYIMESSYMKLYVALAPTNIKVKDFKSYSNSKYTVKSSEFTPKQQLINALWFTDILMRTNRSKNVDSILPREIRTKSNKTKFFNFLKYDATFKEKYQCIDFVENIPHTNSLSAPYATVHNQFFINDSIYPNIISGFNSKEKESFEITMNKIIQIYQKYLKNDNNRDEYEYWYTETISKGAQNAFGLGGSEKDFKIIFDQHKKRLDIMANAYQIYNTNKFSFHEFEVAYDRAGSDIKTLLQYGDVKNGSSYWEKQIKSVINSIDVFNIFTRLTSWIEKLSVNLGDKLDINSKTGIPAYILQDSIKFPLLQSLYKRGAYIAGVSPIDYTLDIKEFNTSIIVPNLGKNDKVKLSNTELKTSKGEVIGKFKKLILDTKLFDNGKGLLYYYPVIEFDFNKVKNIYGIDPTKLTNSYITTEEEINKFISEGSHTKFLPCVIRVGCTQIPESKIPTIQQIYNQGGLYVGVDANDDGSLKVNDTKAVFDPSVLYVWENNDFKNLFNVTVYNLIEAINGNNFGTYIYCKERLENELNLKQNADINWKEKIGNVTLTTKDNITYRSDLNKLPCVYNSELNFNLDKEVTVSKTTQDAIKNRFKQCAIETAFKINDFNENGYLYIQDNSDFINIVNIASQDASGYALVCRFDTDFIKSDDIGVLTVSEKNPIPTNSAESSYTINVTTNSNKTGFINSVELKEQFQVSLHNSDFSYMPLTSKKWYPNEIHKRLTEDKPGSLNPSTTFKPRDNDLKLLIQRYKVEGDPINGGRTIGKLYINGEYFCDTLEDYDRGNIKSIKQKEKDKTAINTGIYKVISSYSESLMRDLPLLQNVPFFEGIRIHTGASEDNTSGCILVGIYQNGNWYRSDVSVNTLTDLVAEYNTTAIVKIERLYNV